MANVLPVSKIEKHQCLHCDKIRPITISYQIIIDVLFAANNELDKMVVAVVVYMCVYMCDM